MQNSLLIFFVVLLSNSLLFGQTTNLQKIDAYLKEYQTQIPIPGFSIAIVEGDKIVFQKGYGVEKEGASKKMSTSSSLGIGSLGRSFTAVGIMQLVEQGLVRIAIWAQSTNQVIQSDKQGRDNF
ncbi:MAG: serine hydrolase [Bacteroidota bacterium]